MGCYNMVGFYSNLPIKANDDIVYFICASYGNLYDYNVLEPNDIILKITKGKSNVTEEHHKKIQ